MIELSDNYCFKHFLIIGVHPYYPMPKYRVCFNVAVWVLVLYLVVYQFCLDGNLEAVESTTMLFMVETKYLTFVFGRNVIKKILKARDQFWEVDISDEQITFLTRYINGFIKYSKIAYAVGLLIVGGKPFISSGTTVFNCYIPSFASFNIVFIVELYCISIGASAYISFGVFTCSLLTSVVTQFRLLNLKIQDLKFDIDTSPQEFEKCKNNLIKLIKYQQFLLRYVELMNKLLSIHLASLMVLYIPLTGTLLANEKPLLERCKVCMQIFTFLVEAFLVYGYPTELLMDQVSNTGETVYCDCEWYLPQVVKLRQHFLFMIARSQYCVYIKAGGYWIVNNSAILAIVKTTYSFYTFLQQQRS